MYWTNKNSTKNEGHVHTDPHSLLKNSVASLISNFIICLPVTPKSNPGHMIDYLPSGVLVRWQHSYNLFCSWVLEFPLKCHNFTIHLFNMIWHQMSLVAVSTCLNTWHLRSSDLWREHISPDHGRGWGSHKCPMRRQNAPTFSPLQGKRRWADTGSPLSHQPCETSGIKVKEG